MSATEMYFLAEEIGRATEKARLDTEIALLEHQAVRGPEEQVRYELLSARRVELTSNLSFEQALTSVREGQERPVILKDSLSPAQAVSPKPEIDSSGLAH